MSSPAIVPSPIDLTTLNDVKSWCGIGLENHTDDVEIQDVITSFSLSVLNQCGVKSFNQIDQYGETRDGNGNNQIFVRYRPVVNVVSVTVNGVAVPAAGPWPSYGYYVSDSRKSIMIRSGSASRSTVYSRGRNTSSGFSRGQGNVQLIYNAGYLRVPADLEMAVRKGSALYHRRKQNLDLASKSIAAGGTTGTTRFRDWEVPPEICSVIDLYSPVTAI